METSESLLRHIHKHVAELSGREISNIIWSLGQLRLNFQEIVRPAATEVCSSPELDDDWQEQEQEFYATLEAALCARIRDRASSMSAYDLESTLNGLAHTAIGKSQLLTVLPELTPYLLIRLTDKAVNSFFFVHVVSSLSLMPVRFASSADHNHMHLNATLEAALVEHAVQKFHAFNGRQFPTLLMSLSRLGLTAGRLTAFQRGRMTAVMSRVLMSLDAEGVVASLLALQRMGFTWQDHFVLPTQSQSNSPSTTEALGGRVLAYVRSNIGSFREVDMSWLLFALGRLGLDWGSVDEAFERKVSNRLGKVARFLPLARAALAVRGLELMKVEAWDQLSVNATQALDVALPVVASGHDKKDNMDLSVLLASLKALKYANFSTLLSSAGLSSDIIIIESVDPPVLASHTTAVTDAHMEGLLKKYTIQST